MSLPRKKCTIILQLLLSSLLVIAGGEPIGYLTKETNKTNAGLSENLPKELPCPDANEILPCHCYYDDSSIDIDCSRVINEDELKAVFSKTFPFNRFRSFNMNHNKNVKVIRAGDLGTSSFELVSIHYGTLTEIEDGALANSRDTLEKMDMWGNDLDAVPDISIFSKLTYIDVRSNEVTKIPILNSSSLQHLDLSHNAITEVPVDSLDGLSALEVLYLNVNSISSLHPESLTRNGKLEKLMLNSNRLSSIPLNTLKLNGANSHLSLSSNSFTGVTYEALSSVTGTLDLRNNQLTQLPEKDFKPFLLNNVKVDLSYNPFGCGCDIAWLILNRTMVEQVHNAGHPTCTDGQAFQNLDTTFYETMC